MSALATVHPLTSHRAPVVATPVRTRVRLEITRRGRIVRACVVLLAAVSLAFTVMTLTGMSSAVAAWVQGPQYVSVTVQPGDTLWGFADTYAPAGEDPRDYVLEIQAANDLPGMGVTAGTQLDLPISR